MNYTSGAPSRRRRVRVLGRGPCGRVRRGEGGGAGGQEQEQEAHRRQGQEEEEEAEAEEKEEEGQEERGEDGVTVMILDVVCIK